jgi:hypothetical protein
MTPQLLLQESASFRRMVVLVVLIAILLFNWQPDPRLLSAPAQRREDDRRLPREGSEMDLRAARPLRSAHLEGPPRPLPGVRQAARRRPGRRG